MATSVRLPDDLDKRLSDLARRTGRSKAFYIREAIEQQIEDLEDYYDAVRISQAVREGKARVVSAEDVWGDLGLDD
ncbi:type II toxin-antitoxin system RelB family antitoxin [Alcanivorax quisquiliarum]|uniref:DUF6290 family protein n=1 Tax=Alcanivorax quisquiliarum TaxID=2933565 RepID=A0ABT0EAM2_9GAMM|nr:DUF6290 family protein [Alcanivorax quisquiliarum]MCK0538881.1 DUF6290 family protein [Alcanivorax quisquiliarum]